MQTWNLTMKLLKDLKRLLQIGEAAMGGKAAKKVIVIKSRLVNIVV